MRMVFRLLLFSLFNMLEILLSYPQFTNNHMNKRASFDHKNICDIPQTNASTFLWSINTWPTSFLFGTIHVPYVQVWPHVSLAVRESFRVSDKVFFELDLTNAGNHNELINCQILPKNHSVKSYLDSDTIERISNLLWRYRNEKISTLPKEKLIGFQSKIEHLTRNWMSKRPFWLLIMLSDLVKTPNNEIAVLDLYLAQEARRMKKSIGSIEDVRDQCGPINSIPHNHVAKWIRKTVLNLESQSFKHENVDKNLDDLINLYNCGDPSMVTHTENKLPTISIDEVTAEDIQEDLDSDKDIKKGIYQNMVVKRNEKMASNIVNELKKAVASQQSVFFAIGAGHFFGENDTILDFLRKHGYEMTPILRNNYKNVYLNRNSQRHRTRGRLQFSKVNNMNQSNRQKTMEISMPDDGTLLLDESDELPKFNPKYTIFQNKVIPMKDLNYHVNAEQSPLTKRENANRNYRADYLSSQATPHINQGQSNLVIINYNKHFMLKLVLLFLIVFGIA